ncbi:MAG: Helicase-like protein [Candidatus Collierbacteria bacterium GW2011_GWC2_44_18]|uniref:Helicase-like protein n=2 Tax=Microgenomates group TaxID=1794810 RepID=A0A0G1J7H9_9BACT|nr:MAG: Helicase-like protein [Candidatus Collierbacteria bacterium GW2011_GWC2_44_18]KKT67240.1 MAG: Helicase-like protein [Candidatus Woesebacteria bacterium GW2011_GWA2_44_33]
MTNTSTKPKGATTYKETAFGIISRSELLKLELEGTKRGLIFVGKNYKEDITPEFILRVHNTAFGWIFPEWAGKYRSIRVEFSGKEPVLPHQIPEQILNLCADLNERLNNLNKNDEAYIENVVSLLAWFQHRFVWIHPFQDYNGRVARMITIQILLRMELPPIEIKAESNTDRQKYLNAMYSADEGNYEKLEKLIESALNESLKSTT